MREVVARNCDSSTALWGGEKATMGWPVGGRSLVRMFEHHPTPNDMNETCEVADGLEILPERHDSNCRFNVMPDRPVEETLKVREYRCGPGYVEAHFDREYRSSMASSPSHLIFLTALAHTQKMLYLALCREFSLPYDPKGAELFKMWPTKIEVKIPTLLAQEKDCVQQLWLRSVKKLPNGARRAVIDVRVDTMTIKAVVPIFMLDESEE